MRFMISGSDYNIQQETILDATRKIRPQPPDGRCKYFVMIDGQRYLIKQLLAGAKGLKNTGFTAQYAHRILGKLGFDVQEFGTRRPRFVSESATAPYASDPSTSSQPLTNEETLSSSDTRKFAVRLENDEDGFLVVSCPELPGCHSQGRTRVEALKNVREAIRGYAASMEAHGEEVPTVDWAVVEVSI